MTDARVAQEAKRALLATPGDARTARVAKRALLATPGDARVARVRKRALIAGGTTEGRPVRGDVQALAFTASSGSITLSGVVAGDLLLLFIGGYGQSYANARQIVSLPPGFALAGGTFASPTVFVGAYNTARTGFTVASKIADGSETTLTVTYAIDVNTNYTRMIVGVAYRNATLAEVVDSSDVGGTKSTAGSVAAPANSIGLSVGAESTNTINGAINGATSDTGTRFYFYPRPYNSSGLPSIALADFPMTTGATLPVTDWVWVGSNGGPIGLRGATTLLLAPVVTPTGPSWSVWNGTTEEAATVTVWNGTTEVAVGGTEIV